MISVILSTNNELRNNYLAKVLEGIKNQNTETELITVDNGSIDGTVELCEKYGRVISFPNSNRAERLNKWLEQIKWNIVVFHHPVSILPKNTFFKIQKKMSWENIWGAYSHSFDMQNLLLDFTSWYSNNVRGKLKSILYLDHIIFAKTDVVKKVWGFPNIDIFEDTIFSQRMRKISRPVILNDKIITSARRFTKKWIWKHALLNQYLKVMFHLWSWDKKMNTLYEKKEWFNVNY